MQNKKLKLQYIYDTKDGELCILINGIKYSYFLDTAIIPKIVNQIQKSSGKAILQIKKSARSYYKHE